MEVGRFDGGGSGCFVTHVSNAHKLRSLCLPSPFAVVDRDTFAADADPELGPDGRPHRLAEFQTDPV
jgi:hypothetical protein